MISKIYLTYRSLSDIELIKKYSITKWGVRRANEYLSSFEEGFAIIGENPKLLKTNPLISSQYKVYQIQKHWLICEIIEKDIYIITIKHTSINLIMKLKELQPTLDEEVRILSKQLKNR